MDEWSVISKYVSGPMALVVIGLAIAVRVLYRDLKENRAQARADAEAHAEQVRADAEAHAARYEALLRENLKTLATLDRDEGVEG